MSEFKNFKYVDTIPKRDKLRRQLWVLVYTLFFKPTPRGLFHAWRRFLLRVFGAKIGIGSKIAPSCFVWAPWNLEVGDYTALGDNVDCYTMAKIQIGSKVAVSQRSFLCTGSHDTNSLLRPLITTPIVIADHVWVAAESMIFPGVQLGEGAVIGARSLVKHDMPAWKICAGSPCKPLKDRVLYDEHQQLISRT